MAKPNATRRSNQPIGYFEVSQRPMAALALLVPLVALYEIGTLAAGPTLHGEASRVVAFHLLEMFFSILGAASFHLPALAVVAVLIAWHVACRDPWTIHLPTTLAMALESIVLALPLLMLSRLVGPIPFASTQPAQWGDEIILSIGAGIYEELLFRLILISLLGMALVDFARMRRSTGYAIAVVLSSLLFAAHHYAPLTTEPFAMGSFAFRAVAGLYLSLVFVLRGFGLAVGCHAAYDLMLVLGQWHYAGQPQ